MLYYTAGLPAPFLSNLSTIVSLSKRAKKYDRPSFTGVAAEMLDRVNAALDKLFEVWGGEEEGGGKRRR